jgi:hypothetical protein
VVTELSRYVAEISSPAQKAFILHGQDEVLAHPALADRPQAGTRERPLPLLSEVDDRVLQQIWSAERRPMNLRLRSTDQGHIVPFPDDYFIYMYWEDQQGVPRSMRDTMRSRPLSPSRSQSVGGSQL